MVSGPRAAGGAGALGATRTGCSGAGVRVALAGLPPLPLVRNRAKATAAAAAPTRAGTSQRRRPPRREVAGRPGLVGPRLRGPRGLEGRPELLGGLRLAIGLLVGLFVGLAVGLPVRPGIGFRLGVGVPLVRDRREQLRIVPLVVPAVFPGRREGGGAAGRPAARGARSAACPNPIDSSGAPLRAVPRESLPSNCLGPMLITTECPGRRFEAGHGPFCARPALSTAFPSRRAPPRGCRRRSPAPAGSRRAAPGARTPGRGRARPAGRGPARTAR